VSQASRVSNLPASPSPFVMHDEEFEAVLGHAPRLESLIDVDAHEGPVYVADENALYFTTVPQPGPSVDIKRLSLESLTVSVVRPDVGAANGMALGRDGRLVVCEQLGGAMTVVDRGSGARTVLVEGFNSPNDVVVKSDGTIWFTDPSYGWLQGFRPWPQLRDGVRRYDPRTGRVKTVADSSFDKPNGLCFSPDESVLYVTDSGANHEPGSFEPARPHHIKAFDVLEHGRLENERVFADVEPGFPDGIKVDSAGRVYASSFSGVQVFDTSGGLIGEIDLPGAVNFCFGGPNRNVLFITADTAIHAATLQAKGL
jgi:gluconolactonase